MKQGYRFFFEDFDETAIYRIKIKGDIGSKILENVSGNFAGKTKDGEIFPKFYPEEKIIVGVCRHNTKIFEVRLEEKVTITLNMNQVEYYQYLEPYPQK